MDHYHFPGKGADITIDHINRIGTDNRKENLRLSNQTEQNYNQSKRTRTTKLPAGCGIDPNDIPTNIEYHPENGAHGEYFEVVIKMNGEKVCRRKTTKSKKVSLLMKLNEAKNIINNLMSEKPEYFKGRCMNGELSEEGKELYKSYFEILRLAGVSDPFNEEDHETYGLSKLLSTNKSKVSIKRKKNMPNISTGIIELPRYCRYINAKGNRGDYFEYECRENGRVSYRSSTSKAYTTVEKYGQLVKILSDKGLLKYSDVT